MQHYTTMLRVLASLDVRLRPEPAIWSDIFGCSLVSQRTDVPSEEGAELQRLYGEYTEGTARAAAALLAGDSQGFREEDGKVGLIVRRIKEIFGTTGHWSGWFDSWPRPP